MRGVGWLALLEGYPSVGPSMGKCVSTSLWRVREMRELALGCSGPRDAIALYIIALVDET